ARRATRGPTSRRRSSLLLRLDGARRETHAVDAATVHALDAEGSRVDLDGVSGDRAAAELAHEVARDGLVGPVRWHRHAGAFEEFIGAKRSGEGEPAAAAHHIGP